MLLELPFYIVVVFFKRPSHRNIHLRSIETKSNRFLSLENIKAFKAYVNPEIPSGLNSLPNHDNFISVDSLTRCWIFVQKTRCCLQQLQINADTRVNKINYLHTHIRVLTYWVSAEVTMKAMSVSEIWLRTREYVRISSSSLHRGISQSRRPFSGSPSAV